MSEQLKLALGAKRDAMRKVLDSAGVDWQTLARLVVRTMRGQEVTGEDIRLRCAELGINPPHHNAWGALINQLQHPRDGTRPYLIATDRFVPMRGPKSNARVTRVYVVPRDL
jgi:hypothetical protein